MLITLILIGQEYPYSANEKSGNRSFHWYQTLDWLKRDLTDTQGFSEHWKGSVFTCSFKENGKITRNMARAKKLGHEI